MKRFLIMLITFSMLFGSAAAVTAAESVDAHQIEMKTFPLYIASADNILTEKFPLYFVDGVDDLPFMELNDWVGFINNLKKLFGDDYHVTLEIKEKKNKAVLVREKETNTMEIDFDKGTISFRDYVGFIQSTDKAYMNPIDFSATDQDGQPNLLEISDSRNQYGDFTVLDLKKYNIPMIAQDGKYLLPMQTLSAFLISHTGYGMYYNGEGLFFAAVSTMVDPIEQLTTTLVKMGLETPEIAQKLADSGGTQAQKARKLVEEVKKSSDTGAKIIEQFNDSQKNNLYLLYTSVPKTVRSDALTEYGYNELCLEMDCFYGLKEVHHIRDFDTLFRQTDMYGNLMNPDSSYADKAISNLTYYWLDDGHSGLLSAAPMTENPPDPSMGLDLQVRYEMIATLGSIRAQHPEAAMPYYEVGDTAYVCFDEYTASGSTDYYQLSEMPKDTIGIIIEAHKQITRENSPVKNVVLDMSNNGGGSLDAGLFTLGWFLGDARFSYRNTFTGAQSTSIVRADVNLDHQFDENDTLAGRGLKLYCLTSPLSFSCGNLVPWAFKENGGVTLLGKITGGGSCEIGYNTTAWGTSYQYSSSRRLSFLKNGAYYDLDRGVEPDFVIDDYDHFYDRKALTEFIHNLY